ncbi:MAG: hypothetical protein B7Z60_02395 [Ferrovum sp. 37-45-19]|uniref:hypothetical protein n=1 Tax=Ferrovum sp. JA12 TaxID=1356299 RepID=UPI000702500D|nr:hypothetical protein [Ferrovum sp. JA12]OYV80315.1 MAG: hypothetical protein B7Z65_01900 [Ferrovum sp. 21-44-67]OYV95060.1 MAG: hypothetical protein B7Z60_02395 [Ferrovum sp. 37-45-19]OZB33607.1 MAG: hypothetical protein B7X47_03600 [Ferrovum sp. 34-44-207]HQT80879.1 hypothetical protein [Ferrovaceae bacterium]KRH78721.1 2-keto-4-pentenoate hydratase [Ferrovum sp. JA12]
MNTLSRHLFAAITDKKRIHREADLEPHSLEEAYHVQNDLIKLMGDNIAAWKVGTGDSIHSVFSSPLPSQWLYHNPTVLSLNNYSLIGIELEYAFRLTHIHLIDQATTLQELDEHIIEVAPAIEIVSTRLPDWPELPAYLKAADLQSNGALVIGEPRPYSSSIEFLEPSISLTCNNEEKTQLIGKNPAGDPRLLLPSLVAQQRKLRREMKPTHWITTGSLSGIFFIEYVSTIQGTIKGFSPINVTFK